MKSQSGQDTTEKVEAGMWAETLDSADPVQVERATAMLRAVIGRLDTFGSRVSVAFPGASKILIDATGERAVIASGELETDVDIVLSPAHLISLINSESDPRMTIQFGHIRASKNTLLAIRLCDAISGITELHPPPLTKDLPRATEDLERAKSDLQTFGYCIVKNALAGEQLAALRTRLVEQAAGENELGVALRDGGASLPNQRLFGLINKGQEFIDLAEHRFVDEFCLPLLGEGYLLNAITANIAGPGGEPSPLHYDQGVYQPTPTFLCELNFLWFLDDITEANGGTRVIPGSHLWKRGPANPYSIAETVAAEGPAGSIMITDGRLWHATGQNRTKANRHLIIMTINRYYLRPSENFYLLTAPDVLASASDKVKTMLGYRVTGRLGFVEDVREGAFVSRLEKPVRALRPSPAPG